MPVRWGIIGCGNVTEVKSGPGFQNARDSSLVAVMRRNAEKARDYAERHGVPRWYSNASDLIADPEVDIVSIATPPSTHCELALQVCAAGKPALVEKPMAASWAECRRMVEAFQDAGLPLFVAYYRRALPRFKKVQELLASGRIGSIRAVSVRYFAPWRNFDRENLPWRFRPGISGGGLFLDLASHTLDVLDYLLGPVAASAGFASNQGSSYPAEDSVSLALKLESGALGTGLWQFGADRSEDTIEVQGDRGRLTFATFGDGPIHLSSGGADEEFVIPNPTAIQQPLIQTIVDELNGGPPCPSTGVSAARTSRVMEQALWEYYRE